MEFYSQNERLKINNLRTFSAKQTFELILEEANTNSMKINAFVIYCCASLQLKGNPIEFNIAKGESCFLFFQEEGKAETVTPIKQYTYTNESFGSKDTCITLDFNKEDEELRLFIQLRKRDVPIVGTLSRATFQIANNPNTILSKNADVDKYVIWRSKELTEIKQIVVDKATGRNFCVTVYISENAENIQKKVKIPKGFVAFEWNFKDPFDKFERHKDYFKQFK